MTNSAENIQENIYSDKFDTQTVSSLSLFLFDEKYILLSKDVNGEVSGIHQKFFSDLKSLSFVIQRDKLYALDVPKKIFLFHKPAALIPGLIFDSNHLPYYLGFVEKNSIDVSYLFSNLDSNNCYLVSKINNELKAIFTGNQSKLSFHHGASSFLSYILKDKNTYINQEIFISVYSQGFYLAAFKNQTLTVFNTFDCEDRETLMKYLFGIVKHLNFDQKYCRITLFGEYTALDIDQEFGHTYFKNFILDQPKANQQYQASASIFQNSNLFEAFWEY
ncbi:hypothetical protein Belba_2290 [Belliella baltica DSM 15883]|uniref:DUF3822 domain-containing protein n=1 Tax=Belliella baltica (strain DSM 15883 / CIP 108006 / LMG 21964 / BA134) TaxID=866536 RepID=I3Z6I6_BELBD|nr:DUF3822 family protein [Belliella baltica]AFL84854.1 hypothetical protein Belba_2290 [Belliella baltica DSM 15883]